MISAAHYDYSATALSEGSIKRSSGRESNRRIQKTPNSESKKGIRNREKNLNAENLPAKRKWAPV
jgi:hypothetical protein